MHLHVIVFLYHIQLSAQRHVLHKHPAGAASWDDEWVRELQCHPAVQTKFSDQCEYGLLTPNEQGDEGLPDRFPSMLRLLEEKKKRSRGDKKKKKRADREWEAEEKRRAKMKRLAEQLRMPDDL